MALRALILRNKLDIKKRELEALRAKDSEIQRRETELGQAIEEMTDETSEAVSYTHLEVYKRQA